MNRQVTNMFDVRVSDEVATALAEGRAVVAMESTIFSHLGLPSPANEEALSRCEHAVRAVGAVPAVTAVFNGSGLELDPRLPPEVPQPACDMDRCPPGHPHLHLHSEWKQARHAIISVHGN